MADHFSRAIGCPDRVRNFCVVAHVDHGKTSLTDHLVASNGIISSVEAGGLRYMDSRRDEEDKRITMKTSSIALLHQAKQAVHVLNLMDSPGHIDLSPEVFAAVRVCDGALVLVDVVEGVRSQTQVVLRQAYEERLSLCLILNKIDLLFTKLRYDATDVAGRLGEILASVNVLMSSFILNDGITTGGGDVEGDDFFSPTKGNVVFCSALAGWAFTVPQMAKLCAQKMKCNDQALLKALWGPYFFDPKAKRVKKEPVKPRQPEMFTQFIIQPLADVYDIVTVQQDVEKCKTLAEKMGVEMKPKHLTMVQSNPTMLAKHLLSHWLPLAPTVLDAIIDLVPAPSDPRASRSLHTIFPTLTSTVTPLPEGDSAFLDHVRDAMERCDPNCDVVVAYITKMLAPTRNEPLYLGLCKVMCGTLRAGDTLYALAEGADDPYPFAFQRAHVLGHCNTLEAVPAGSIVGIPGLDTLPEPISTLTNDIRVPAGCGTGSKADSLVVDVMLSPKQADGRDFHADLTKLNHATACLLATDKQLQAKLVDGGVILSVAGQLHLERYVHDIENLEELELEVSAPIVRLKETIVEAPTMFPKAVRFLSPSGRCRLSVRARPLPAPVQEYLTGSQVETLEDRMEKVKELLAAAEWDAQSVWLMGSHSQLGANILLNQSPGWKVGFGDQPGGSSSSGRCPQSAATPPSPTAGGTGAAAGCHTTTDTDTDAWTEVWAPLETAFRRVTASGPICGEPLTGVAFTVEDVEFFREPTVDEMEAQRVAEEAAAWGTAEERQNRSDEIDAMREKALLQRRLERPVAVRDEIRNLAMRAFTAAFSREPRRVVEPMYECHIMAMGDVSGQVYALLGQHRAQVLRDDLLEGTTMHVIDATLPVIESFGFTQNLRLGTGGLATPALKLSHWEVLDEDPYWVPTTEEELEDEERDHEAELIVPEGAVFRLVWEKRHRNTQGDQGKALVVLKEGENTKDDSCRAA